MPKYTENKVCDCYLYFTADCIIEAMHAHANEKGTIRRGAAKFWVYSDGSTKVADKGTLSQQQIKGIQNYIKKNLPQMVEKWANFVGVDKSNVEFRNK